MFESSLIFRFPAAESRDLILGTLELTPRDPLQEMSSPLSLSSPRKRGSTLWTATSGLPRYQRFGDYLLRAKGPIPSTNALLAHNSPYRVSTQSLLVSKRGIEGPFFPIIPGFISLDFRDGLFIHRDGFGIHFDANVPGSIGCIVLTKHPEFADFIQTMADFHLRGITALPLEVIYV